MKTDLEQNCLIHWEHVTDGEYVKQGNQFIGSCYYDKEFAYWYMKASNNRADKVLKPIGVWKITLKTV